MKLSITGDHINIDNEIKNSFLDIFIDDGNKIIMAKLILDVIGFTSYYCSRNVIRVELINNTNILLQICMLLIEYLIDDDMTEISLLKMYKLIEKIKNLC